MVENSLGRLWVEGHPNDGLKENWRYYLEEAEQEPEVEAQLAEIRQEYAALNPEDIKVIDPCMGSGHILVYAFDVLMQIYESQGYTQRDAAQSILANNLFGLDIDERAAQLAYFAVMMKARQYDRRILTRGIWPHVLAIQESNGIHRAHLDYFGAGMSELEKNTARMQLEDLLETLRDAKEYGSILRVENWEWDLLRRFVAGMDMVSQITLDSIGVEDTAEKLMHLIDVGQVLAQKYNVAVTNPPYMGSANMGPKLLRFVKENYADYKSDLFAVFILRLRYFTEEHGLYSLITQQAWMFKSSYRNLRPNIYRNLIISLLHLGAHAFDELNGEVVQTVAFVQQKYECLNYIGNYISLEEYPSETEKEEAFLTHSHIYGTKAKSFMEIPNQPTAYWITEAQANCFDNFCTLSQSGVVACAGLNTSDNDRFVRLWQEVDIKSIAFHASKHEDLISSGQKYAPFNKGGGYRKWYGNQSYIIAFNMENYRILSTIGNHLPSRQYYFRPCLTWNRISSAENFSVRYCDSGFVFDDVSPSAFMDNNHFPYTIGLMNAKPYSLLLRVLNKGMKTETGNVQKTPFAVSLKENEQVTHIADDSIQLSRKDWDSYETSWDFKRHPLV